MGALGSLSLRAVLPELLKGDCDIKILISTTFSRHIGGNRALNRREDDDLVLVRVDLHADIIT